MLMKYFFIRFVWETRIFLFLEPEILQNTRADHILIQFKNAFFKFSLDSKIIILRSGKDRLFFINITEIQNRTK